MKRSAPPDFDRVADIYRWGEYCTLGPLLQRIRTHFIPYLSDRKCAHVMGDGDGRFLEALLRDNGHLTATAIDTSGRMLTLLNRRCADMSDRVCLQKASALLTSPEPHTDLIVSHFFLDCMTQEDVESLVLRVSSACRSGAFWLISDFQIPQQNPWRTLGMFYIDSLYRVFRILTDLQVRQLPDTRVPLKAAGFKRIAYHQTLFGLLYTEVWELTERPTDTQPDAPVVTSTRTASQEGLSTTA